MKEMKKYHLAHHYKNFELGYGVTSEASLEPLALQMLISFFQARFGIMSSTLFSPYKYRNFTVITLVRCLGMA